MEDQRAEAAMQNKLWPHVVHQGMFPQDWHTHGQTPLTLTTGMAHINMHKRDKKHMLIPGSPVKNDLFVQIGEMLCPNGKSLGHS